jgi:CRISP-associated protein Cas1
MSDDEPIDPDPTPAIPQIPRRVDEELLPARMLNEFTYCPRLAYLEWVQGEWEENPDTVDGEFVHRNADRPDKRPVPTPEATVVTTSPSSGDTARELQEPASADEVERLHARSVKLENVELGIVAVCDIIEVEGTIATPVDYKKGKAPEIPEGAWEPERVQVCAQGLLLRAAGFTVTEGVIWYHASRRRVTIPFDDALVERTKQLIRDCREMAKGGRMPLPLVDSPKCPRCSLVGICLPDETHLLIRRDRDDSDDESAGLDSEPFAKPKDPRRLLTPSPETIPLHVLEPWAYIRKKNDRLTIEVDNAKIGEARIKDLSQVCVYGNAQITTQAMHELFGRDIPILYFTSSGWFKAISQGLPHKNVELRIRQYDAASQLPKALPLARAFVAGKIRNCRTLIRRNADSEDRLLADLAQSAKEAERATSIESLMGIEGMAAKRYFAGFAGLIKEEHGFHFEGRNRRPPTDGVNAVLSFLYACLCREMTVAALSAGLDPYLGFLHQPRYGRPALGLDLAEEFRPLLADSTALSLFNTGELDPEDFIGRAGAVAMKPHAKKVVLGAWERRLQSEVTHPIFGYTLSYRRVLMVQARLLGRAISGEIPQYPAFKTR